MPEVLSVDELIAQLETESTRMVQETARVLLSDPVPTCPQWSVRQLVEHLGGIHRWAAAIVSRGLQGDVPEAEQEVLFTPPDGQEELLPWFTDGAAELVKALRSAPDDLRAFVFLKQAPPARQFWARRQAHETTIHRVDALAARLGRMPSTAEAGIPTEIAVDGLAELVAGFVPRRSSRLRTTEPFVMAITPTDADAAWTIAVSDEPPVVTPGADPHAHAVISGSAAALYLGLWNRGDDIAENGTVEALGHWRDQVRVAWS
jgi:uncharacterized protein (TIGR03083 family)